MTTPTITPMKTRRYTPQQKRDRAERSRQWNTIWRTPKIFPNLSVECRVYIALLDAAIIYEDELGELVARPPCQTRMRMATIRQICNDYGVNAQAVVNALTESYQQKKTPPTLI